jgi:hypothetical protein
MAVAHAVFLHNHVPNSTTGLAPQQCFTKSRCEQHKFHDVHVWGCPVYVLDSKISGGVKLPCWTSNSTCCINVGLSTNHASTVALVLNPASSYITAQFDIVFDNWFATIAADVDAFPNSTPTISTRLMKTIWPRNVTNSQLTTVERSNMSEAKPIVPRLQQPWMSTFPRCLSQ